MTDTARLAQDLKHDRKAVVNWMSADQGGAPR